MLMEKSNVLLEQLQKRIDEAEQQMAAMMGAKLYKQPEGFTQAQIYTLGGREDSVFTLTLRTDSESYKKYGESITVCFVYNVYDRKALESNAEYLNALPYAKAKLLVPINEVEKEKELLTTGILTTDIVEMVVLPPMDMNNTFPSKENRTPNVIEVPFEAEEGGRDIIWMYEFMKGQKERGVGLMPEDEAAYLAYKLVLERNELTDDEKRRVFNTDDKIADKQVAYKLLAWKEEADVINDKEKELLNKLRKERISERITLLEFVLDEMGMTLLRFYKDYPKQAEIITEKILTFNDKSFNVTGRFPLYMNFESLLHLYFRHVKEMNVSDQFASRDKFQLEEKDILTVVDIVMKDLNDEYQAFKEENPDSRFYRTNSMAYYYNGDYYNVDVNSDGCLKTFYRGLGKKKGNI